MRYLVSLYNNASFFKKVVNIQFKIMLWKIVGFCLQKSLVEVY